MVFNLFSHANIIIDSLFHKRRGFSISRVSAQIKKNTSILHDLASNDLKSVYEQYDRILNLNNLLRVDDWLVIPNADPV